MKYHSLSGYDTAEKMFTDLQKGLTRHEAEKRIRKYGKNEIIQEKKQGLITRFFNQFKDFMTIILLGAAAISFVMSFLNGDNEYIDSIIILAIVVCNAIIGTVQEVKADRAIEALKKMSSPHSTVIRGGKKEFIESAEVVSGDLIILTAGDMVSADVRLIKTVEMKTEESTLTGESVPVEKNADAICAEGAAVGERANMVFAGTGVASGSGMGIVVATGMETSMGQIAKMLANEKAPETPLQQKLSQLGKILGIGVVVICAVIFVLGLIQKTDPLEMFMIAISLAVAAIPEGLPAVVTIVLAIGIKRMAQRRAIIRNMPAVETLGSTQIICSDKTGTLTQNKMTVTAFVSSMGEHDIDSMESQFALSLCTLCNNADKSGKKIIGDPTEAAFLNACIKSKKELEQHYPRTGEIPFTSARKKMTTAHKSENGYRVITKGAPDVLLKSCTHYLRNNAVVAMGEDMRRKMLKENDRLADKALRVLAVAYKDVNTISSNDRETESALIFCGLIGMEDPPRKGVKNAVRICKTAGIIPVMITGDHAATALAIAKRLHIADDNKSVMVGAELDRLSEAELAVKVFDYRVFARVSPEHKVKIVKAFQKRGKVVAMTGDGVNDAPALKVADIGCAMGKNGTEVAKSAADMILTDDDFSTIVAAVKEGRGIYKNIRKTIHFLVSCNIGEILLIFAAFLLRVPTPLMAIQLLWVNLVTDSLPALALGADTIGKDVMKESPFKKEDGIFSGGMGLSVALEGCLIGALALLAYTIGRGHFDIDPLNPVIGRTMAFTVLSFSQLVHSFNMRSETSVIQAGFFTNKKLVLAVFICATLMISVITMPFLTVIFKTAALNVQQWLIVLSLSLSPLIIVEAEKMIFKFTI